MPHTVPAHHALSRTDLEVHGVLNVAANYVVELIAVAIQQVKSMSGHRP